MICCDANTVVGCARWLVRWLLTTTTPLDGAIIGTRKPKINTIFTRVRLAAWLASNTPLVTIVAYVAVISKLYSETGLELTRARCTEEFFGAKFGHAS